MKILDVKTEKRLIGDLGEKAALNYLRRRGFLILKKNFVGNNGSEIDIIARRVFSSVYAFIEVKTRSSCADFEQRPSAAVTPKKQRKIIGAARSFLPVIEKGGSYRFDVIEVYVEKATKSKYKVTNILHLKDTFSADTAYGQAYR